jgi:hypothetical protein
VPIHRLSVVAPADAALRLRHEEAALDERLRREVELAHDVGVRAAGRERQEAQAIVRLEHVGAVPDPAHALALAERVEVEHRLPVGSAFAYSSGVVRRHSPRGFFASCQRL